jgi:hypothetical protein
MDKQYINKLRDEQDGDPREVIKQQMEEMSEYSLDLDNIKPSKHNWVERGLKISCEGASHPHHSHFLIDKKK